MKANIKHIEINWIIYWKKAEKQHYTDLLTANQNIIKNLANYEKCCEQKWSEKSSFKFRLHDGTLTENKIIISD